MKKLFSFLMCAILALSLAACGGSPAPETEKTAELRAQYGFYDESAKQIKIGIKDITAEQADEVFIVLASHCGLDGAIKDVYKKNSAGNDNTYSYYWDGSAATYDIVLDGGIVSEVYNGSILVYPAPEPTDELPAESEPLTLDAAVDAAIADAGAIKDNVVVGNGVVSIYLKCADNLTLSGVRRSASTEARDILESLQGYEEITRIALFWTFPLIDAYGNETEENVMKIQFEKETLQKINFDNFDWSNFPDIADDYFEHAALSK